MTFSERLKELREEKGLSQGELSQHVNVSRQSIGFYEKGERLPDIETAMNIAKCFNVTTDYLLGLSNIPYTDSRHDEYCRRLIAENAVLERKLSDIKNILQ